MINILYIIDHLWNSNGGTEGQLLMLMNNLDPAKYKTHLFCLKETQWSKTARLDFPMTILHTQRLVTPGIIGKIAVFRRYCRENHIDIVQTYFNDALIFGAIAGRFSGVRRIIACRRNLGPGFWGRKNLLRAFKMVRPLVTRYMANSQATKDSIAHYEGIDPSKIDVIYNGLDLSRFSVINSDLRRRARSSLGLDDSHVLIGMVAHLRKEKNISLFVRAAQGLSKTYPRARFVVIGEGVDGEPIQKQINELGVDKVFKLTGGQMDIVPYLAAMDIACLTSDGESFSNAIIEYLAAGLPVVATALGGNIEAVPDKDFLFPRDDLDKFTSLLDCLIKDEGLRFRLGRLGKETVEDRYSVARMVSGHEAMYETCLREN